MTLKLQFYKTCPLEIKFYLYKITSDFIHDESRLVFEAYVRLIRIFMKISHY